jgi:hypothetical protein
MEHASPQYIICRHQTPDLRNFLSYSINLAQLNYLNVPHMDRSNNATGESELSNHHAQLLWPYSLPTLHLAIEHPPNAFVTPSVGANPHICISGFRHSLLRVHNRIESLFKFDTVIMASEAPSSFCAHLDCTGSSSPATPMEHASCLA